MRIYSKSTGVFSFFKVATFYFKPKNIVRLVVWYYLLFTQCFTHDYIYYP